MKYVSATEFKSNLGRYLDLADKNEEIIITRKGKAPVKLMSARQGQVKSLRGILPAEATLAEAKQERLSKK